MDSLFFDISYTKNGKIICPNVRLKLNKSHHLLVLGASGSGKTTFLSMLAGLLKPSKGLVIYETTNIYELSSTQRDHYRGQNIGIIPQALHLIPVITVRQTLLLAQSLANVSSNPQQVDALLDHLKLLKQSNQIVSSLSTGEKQRLAIARAVINKPKWILADEPTSALDDYSCDKIISLLQEQAQENKASLIIVTHDRRLKSSFMGQQKTIYLDGDHHE